MFRFEIDPARSIKMQKFISAVLSGTLVCVFTGCDVEQTREGELPDIDVDVQGEPGQLPAYDVDTPDVDVSTEEKEVSVPDVDVETEEKTIEVPDVDVSLPEDDQQSRTTEEQ
jgi:hypothetical protein